MVTIESRLAEAVAALVGQRSGDGLWQGFPTLAGQSDLWVSGFVATHLADLELVPVDLAPTRQALVAARADDGGWGYAAHVPTDADSTAWCARAVAPVDSAEGRAEALGVLADHRVGAGYATYRPTSGIVAFVEASTFDTVSGWTVAHPDVTVAVLLAGEPADTGDADDVLRDLVSRQTGAGFVESYWWRGPLYASTLLLRALRRRGRWLGEDAAGLLYRGLARVQFDEGGFGLGADRRPDAFTTALGLEALCHLAGRDHDRRRDRAAEALMALQGSDGGWEGGHVMRIPSAGVVDPRHVARWSRDTGGGNSFVRDVDGVFATCVAVAALDWWARDPGPMVPEVVITPMPALAGDVDVVRPTTS